jgi:hypothetical protein
LVELAISRLASWESTSPCPWGFVKHEPICGVRNSLLARDRANLHEGLRQASQALARSYRNLAQYYEEYLAAKRRAHRRPRQCRSAAEPRSLEVSRRNRANHISTTCRPLPVGATTKSAEAQALLRYNSELTAFELEMGTILETHGIAFYEEGFRSIGPAGRLAHDHCYPRSTPVGENAVRYPGGTEPSENLFKADSPGELLTPRP